MLFEVLTHTWTQSHVVSRKVLKVLKTMEQDGLVGPIKYEAHCVRSFEVSQSNIKQVEKNLQRKDIPYRKKV